MKTQKILMMSGTLSLTMNLMLHHQHPGKPSQRRKWMLKKWMIASKSLGNKCLSTATRDLAVLADYLPTDENQTL